VGVERFGTMGISGGGAFTLATAALLPDRAVAAAVLSGAGLRERALTARMR
jgi:pimeloyl-ACP methyl ester carboxylesterase